MAEFTNEQIDPYLCTCRPCKRFWRNAFKGNANCLIHSEKDRALHSATLRRLRPNIFSIGDRVSVHGCPGSVKFVGFVDDSVVAPVLRIGVKLDETILEGHDGMFNAKRYFTCTNGHGVLVRLKDVTPLKAANKRPPLKGNFMFPSWPEICKRRKQRETMLEEMRKHSSRTVPPGSQTKLPKPSAIFPRENRTHRLRHELTSSGEASEDHQYQKRQKLLAAQMSTPEIVQARWEKGLKQQWQQKYNDPEKVSRMSETLLKLCSAYQDGFRFKQISTD